MELASDQKLDDVMTSSDEGDYFTLGSEYDENGSENGNSEDPEFSSESVCLFFLQP